MRLNTHSQTTSLSSRHKQSCELKSLWITELYLLSEGSCWVNFYASEPQTSILLNNWRSWGLVSKQKGKKKNIWKDVIYNFYISWYLHCSCSAGSLGCHPVWRVCMTLTARLESNYNFSNQFRFSGLMENLIMPYKLYFLYFFLLFPVFFLICLKSPSTSAECCGVFLLWIPRNIWWTTQRHPTPHQHVGVVIGEL